MLLFNSIPIREYNNYERGVHYMDSRKSSIISSYSKYLFMTKEEALLAKHSLSIIFPKLKMKVTNNGSLFCQTHGSLLFELPVLTAVTKLGGTKA